LKAAVRKLKIIINILIFDLFYMFVLRYYDAYCCTKIKFHGAGVPLPAQAQTFLYSKYPDQFWDPHTPLVHRYRDTSG
jgi:hypothetical protein